MTLFATDSSSPAEFKPIMRLQVQASNATPPQAGATVSHPSSPSSPNTALSRAPNATAAPPPVAGQIRPLTLAPSPTIRSHPSGGHVEPANGSGGGDPEPPVPVVTLSGGSTDSSGNYIGVVGGTMLISVWTPYDEDIDSVKYTIEGAVKTQSWTVSAGQSTRLSGPVTHPPDPITQKLHSTIDGMNFYWDETTGTHHITVAVTYPEGTRTVNFTVSVEKPDVSSLSMTYNPLQFGKPPGTASSLGFYQTAPGVYFNATVTTHKFGGEFAFIQSISMDLMQQYSGSSTITETSPTVLDWNGQFPNLPLAVMLADNSYHLQSNETESLPYNTVPYAVPPANEAQDTPYLVFSSYANVLNQPTMFREDVNFTTRLVFRSEDGGIWISLGYMIWNLHGERTYDATKGADRTNPANWVGAESLAPPNQAAGTSAITTELLPDWTENSQPYLQEWNAKKP